MAVPEMVLGLLKVNKRLKGSIATVIVTRRGFIKDIFEHIAFLMRGRDPQEGKIV